MQNVKHNIIFGKGEKMEQRKFEITDAIIIGYFTIILYLVVYGYELGRANYFGYPSELIIIDLQKCIGAFHGLKFFFLLVLVVIMFYRSLKLKSQRFKYVWFCMVVIGFGLFMSFFTGDELSSYYVYAGMFFLLFIWAYIYPLIKYRNVKGVKNKYKEIAKAYDNDPIRTESSITDLYTKAVRFGGRMFVFALLMPLYITYITSYAEGICEREINQSILVYESEEYLLITNYGDNLLVAPIDTSTGIVEQKFKNIPISESYEVTYYEDYGRVIVDR